MGSFSDTPALIAGGTIAPFRFVKVSTAADDTGLQAAEQNSTILGVSDGSTNGPTSANHAIAGEPITLQGGDVVLVQCSGNITRGALVESDANGKAQNATISTGARFHGYVALQSGADGLIIRVQKVSGWRYYP